MADSVPPKRRLARRQLLALLAVAAASFVIGGGAEWGRLWHELELETIDLRYELRGEQDVTAKIVVVEIDDESERDVRARSAGRIPREADIRLPRRAHARVIKRLREDGARMIGYAVEFPGDEREEESHAADDEALLEEVSRTGTQLVLALAFPDAECGKPLEGEIVGGEGFVTDQREGLGSLVAAAYLDQDDDGGVRRIRPKVRADCGDDCGDNVELGYYRPLSFVVARAAREDPEYRQDGCEWIDFRGNPGSFERVSFADVYSGTGDYEPGLVDGTIVIVGPADRYETPTGTMSSAELEANAVSTFVDGRPLREPGTAFNVLVLLAAALWPLLVLLRAPLSRGWLAGWLLGIVVATPLAVLSGSLLSVEEILLVPLTYPLLTLLLSTAGAIWVHRLAVRGRLR